MRSIMERKNGAYEIQTHKQSRHYLQLCEQYVDKPIKVKNI